MRSSLAILLARKKLLFLPLLGRGVFFLILTSLTVLIWAIRSGRIDYNNLSAREILWGYVIILLALWVGNLVSAYFNAALTACLLQDENGQRISLTQGLRAASQQFLTIFWWILAHFTFAGIILIFRSIRESRRVQQLLSGLNWGFAAFLIPPLIIHEPAGFLSTLQRSSQLMRNFAGKNPRVNYSYSLISITLRFLSLVPMTVGYHLQQPVWIITGIILTFVLLLSVVVMINGFVVVLLHALYQYIAHGKTIHHFHTTDLATAITASYTQSV